MYLNAFLLILGTNDNCRDGWDELNNRCYKLNDDATSWVDADRYCKDNSANLIAITSSDEQVYAAAKVNNNNIKTWIGLSSTVSQTQESKTVSYFTFKNQL